MVALLRAVNVGGRKLPMAGLRAAAEALGWTAVSTYIQSGNLIFAAPGGTADLESKLERELAERFAMEVPAMVRTAGQWARLAAANPFPKAAEHEPNRLMMLVSKRPPAAGAAERLMERAKAGEQVRSAAGALWFHYPEGAGTSKLTPSLIDRTVGSPATARNWRTVTRLREMLEA